MMIKSIVKGRAKWFLPFYLFTFLLLFSCNEDNTEEDEYANWEQRNNEMTDIWATMAVNGELQKIKSYAKDPSVSGKSSDYIYVEILEQGNGTESPLFTDSVRLAYRGRQIPTKSYPEGYVFDQSYQGDFSWRTSGMTDFACNGVIEGFSTALMNMHIGDHWRVHIPYQLGYGTSTTSTMRGYSDLTFDIALQDIWHPGETRPNFKARAQE